MKNLSVRNSHLEKFCLEAFQQTDTPFQPTYSWVWNAPIKIEDVKRRLDGMKQAGIRGVYVIPEPKSFRPETMRTFLEPEYLTDEFMQMMREMAQYALSIGMNVWLYDEGGWPSGGAAGRIVKKHPHMKSKGIRPQNTVLPANQPFALKDDAVAAFVCENGKMRRVQEGEQFPEEMELTVYAVEFHGGYGGWATDSLEDGIGEAFVAETHEKYTQFLGDLFPEKEGEAGAERNIELMFTDEPGTGPFPWPDNFVQHFQDTYHYDIRDFLPDLFNLKDDVDGAARKAREDYRELQGKLFVKNYLMPIRDWCKRNRMLATGHLDIDHTTDGCMYHGYGTVLQQLRVFDVPGVDVIWRQIDLPKDGQPPCFEGNGFFERFASSAAAQSGGKYSVSESFAVYGASIDGALARFTIHHQMVRGINLFNFMSMSYSPKNALPVVMRPGYMEEMAGFFHLRAMNNYTARASYLMQLGRPAANTALFYPARNIWAGGACSIDAIHAFETLGKELESKHVDFDIIDEEGLRLAQLDNGALVLGLARYENVIVPEGALLPADIEKILTGIKRDVQPIIDCDQADIRVRARILPDGDWLYMLFNESDKHIRTNVSFAQPGQRIQLDAQTGRAFIDQGNEMDFLPGQARFLLITKGDASFAISAAKPSGKTYNIAGFSIQRLRETLINAEGISARTYDEAPVSARLGGWAEYVGEDFSGEAIYRSQIMLDEVPAKDEAYLLSLGKIENTARVMLNGREVGLVWAAPYEVRISGADFEGRMQATLDIEVANTMTNRIRAAKPREIFDPTILGPYQDRLDEFEANFPAGGLYGPVTLEKLIP